MSARVGLRRKQTAGVRRAGARVAAVVVGAVLVLALPVVGFSQPPVADGLRPTHGRTVTLITGDRVTLNGNAFAVRHGPGRAEMVFEHYRERGHNYVIPADAVRLVNRGRVDRRLFDVTGLLEFGYGDRARGDVPLIAANTPQAMAALRTGDARVTRRLQSLGMTALRASKGDAADFWARIAKTPGVTSIWLDGRRKLTLDGSVPQIGVPAAWSAGFTGAGMTAAVLDTGIDQQSGQPTTEIWGQAVFGPAFPEIEGSPSQWIYRHVGGSDSLTGFETAQDSDGIAVSVPFYNDFSEDHEGFSREDTGRTALYLDGELIGETDRSGLGDFGVPDAPGDYRLEISGSRPSFAELSTEVSATWTFRSRHIPDAEFTPLPVMAIRFGPEFDQNNAAQAGSAFPLPVFVQRQAGVPTADVSRLDLEVSYDDGAIWRAVDLVKTGDHWLAHLFHPADARFVSLRAAAADTREDSVQETILRAYRLR